MTWINAKIIVYKFYTPVTIYQSSYQYHQYCCLRYLGIRHDVMLLLMSLESRKQWQMIQQWERLMSKQVRVLIPSLGLGRGWHWDQACPHTRPRVIIYKTISTRDYLETIGYFKIIYLFWITFFHWNQIYLSRISIFNMGILHPSLLFTR